ncbi:CRR6 family NdhI maturation factor [Geminocystis sp. CENA526]|uniref:CRR6 family NdhI maturation factor n=1 Tax=Geminocystis sp. CENA526 TaxID=1355871 RepID=UPI003D6FEE10
MAINISLNENHINNLDLSPVKTVIEDVEKRQEILTLEQQLVFNIDYPREENDPRELSEIPEIRLWFIALDSVYPWLPFALNWREGELARYTAMLVPHQFNRTEGIQYNQEALDIFVMAKTFILHRWLKQNNITGNSRLKAMAQIFGYDLDDRFFALLN